MDESLFLFSLICGFILLGSIIYCFLSTCLGLQIRRSDLIEAFSFPTPSQIRARDAERRRRAQAQGEGYELDEVDRGVRYGLGGAEEFEMMRRGGVGPGRGLY
ncbi:hypothetical protein CI109_106532 [Kwoniella shandongensis]|uniref:Uncharacterized protein n=1 Tax=Kwoniella shandongensis TaxID=1734106 RepID=A0AAJ8LSL5_9TREE